MRRVFTKQIRKVLRFERILDHLEACNVKKNEYLRLKPHRAGIYWSELKKYNELNRKLNNPQMESHTAIRFTRSHPPRTGTPVNHTHGIGNN